MIDWTLIGGILAAVAIALLLGATMGYYAASTDLEAERLKAREAGFQSGIESAWDLIGPNARRLAHVNLAMQEVDTNERRRPRSHNRNTGIVPDDEQESQA